MLYGLDREEFWREKTNRSKQVLGFYGPITPLVGFYTFTVLIEIELNKCNHSARFSIDLIWNLVTQMYKFKFPKYLGIEHLGFIDT